MDFRLYLISPSGVRTDVSDRVTLDGIGSLSLAVERNLHVFTAGDLGFTLDDGDGSVSALFSDITPSDRWTVELVRDGTRQFTGTIIPLENVSFERKERLAEISALDLSKSVEDVTANEYKRTFGTIAVSSALVGATTLTIPSGTSLLANGDVLELSSAGAKTTVTIASVISATQVSITKALTSAFSGGTAEVQTPYYRFRTAFVLVNDLLDLALAGSAVRGKNVRLDGPPSKIPIFSDQNSNRLPAGYPSGFTSKGGNLHVSFTGPSAYEQTSPELDFSAAGTAEILCDWTPYYANEPSKILRRGSWTPGNCGLDFTLSTGATPFYAVYSYGTGDNGTNAFLNIERATSTDGNTWTALGAFASSRIATKTTGTTFSGVSVEWDPVRLRVYWGYSSGAGSATGYLQLNSDRNVISNVTIATFHVSALRYCSALDVIVGRRGYLGDGTIVVIDPATNAITDRPVTTYLGGLRTARYLNGVWVWFTFLGYDAYLNITTDDFSTVERIQIAEAASVAQGELTIVGDTFRAVTVYNGTNALYLVGSPFFAGIIPYADFEDMSIAQALDELAIVLNAVFFVDREGIANFVLRDLTRGTSARTLDAKVLERSDSPLWTETYDYVEFTLPGGGIGKAGEKTTVSRNLSLSSRLAVSAGVAASAAASLLSFYSKRRKKTTVRLEDDGEIFNLFDLVILDGLSWIVYEVEHDLANYEVNLTLLEVVL